MKKDNLFIGFGLEISLKLLFYFCMSRDSLEKFRSAGFAPHALSS